MTTDAMKMVLSNNGVTIEQVCKFVQTDEKANAEAQALLKNDTDFYEACIIAYLGNCK